MLGGDRRQQPAGGTNTLYGVSRRPGLDPPRAHAGNLDDSGRRVARDVGHDLYSGSFTVHPADAWRHVTNATL
ncbi:hypothetical protein D3C71_2105030 [compost metagenome]